MEKCDCLNYCGDDSRLKTGTVAKCSRYEELHYRVTSLTEAAMFFWLTQQKDNSLIEGVRKEHPNATPIEFYKLLSDRIAREMYAATAARG